MKILFSFSLIVLALFSSAQIKTAIFEGRTVKVFPYRVSSDLIDNIPYCPQVLENGEYVIYYIPVISNATKKHWDTIKVAAMFTIINNKKDGLVKFYEYGISKPYLVGAYANDMKTGEWKKKYNRTTEIANYKDGKLDGLFIETYKYKKRGRNRRSNSCCGNSSYGSIKLMANYKEGKLDGKKIEISSRPYLKEIKEYKAGMRNGLIETYNKRGKLIASDNYIDDLPYGPSFEFIKSEKFYGKQFKNCVIKSFMLNNYQDSFANFYSNDKLIGKVINSKTPIYGFNKNDTLWWLNYRHFEKDGMFENYINNYSEVYEVNSQNKKFNHFYFKDGDIQIPFAKTNPQGDTIIKVERIEMTEDYYKYKIINNYYSKGKLRHKEEKIEKYYKKPKTKPGESQYLTESCNETYFGKRYTEKTFKFDKYLAEYNGIIIKTDSAVIIYKKNKPPLITEKYFIKGIKAASSSVSFNGVNKTPTEFNVKMISTDTLEVTKNKWLTPELNFKSVTKICTKDTALSTQGVYNLINPALIFETNNIEFTGSCGYSVLYNGKPYTGRLICKQKEKKKYYEGKYALKLEDDYYGEKLVLTHKIHKQRFLFIFWDYEDYNSGRPYFCNYFFRNGKLEGPQSCNDRNGKKIYSLNFENGQTEGVQNFPRNYKHTAYGPQDQLNYENGKLQGYVTATNKETELVAQYDKGKLNGNYLGFVNLGNYNNAIQKIKIEAQFNNDTIASDIFIYYYGKLREIIPFKNGCATGVYLRNNSKYIESSNSDSAHNFESYVQHYVEIKARLKNGAYTDSIFGYFDNKTIKYVAIIDTSFHQRYIMDTFIGVPYVYKNSVAEKGNDYLPKLIQYEVNNYYHGSSYVYIEFSHKPTIKADYEMDLDPKSDKTPAYYTFYYKNGLKSQQGHLVGNTKDGNWKYWNENGVLMKEINYEGEDITIDSVQDISIYSKGKIKGYYPSGAPMMEGYITDQALSYQCNQEAEVAYEEVYYTKFKDEKGNDIFNNGNCPVSDYHLNGNICFKGQIANGTRSGLWKFYDPKGNLKEIGEYINGEKHGRWLSGDLGGINYIDNACSVNEAIEMIKLKEVKNIDISEIMYDKGEKLSKSHLVLEKF